MGTDYRYKAFVSYSHADERAASWLHRQLESYRIPKRIVEEHGLEFDRLRPIFRDQDELASSSDLSSSIREALAESENLIVVCSPRSAGSRWVNEEITEFRRLGREARIFCWLLDDPETSFPPALLESMDPEGHGAASAVEPLAADSRETAGGRKRAKLKLIAGLLDVGLDSIKQRDAQRKLRNLSYVFGATTVIAIMMAVLAWTAIVARDEATVNAELAAEEAERASQVNRFLRWTLQQADPVEGAGSQTTVEQMLDSAADGLDNGQLSLDPLAEADTRQTIGLAYMHLGRLEKAAEQFEPMLQLQESDETKDHESQVAGLVATAQLYRRQGELGEAENLLERAATLVAEVEEAERPELAVNLYSTYGLLLRDAGRYAEAANYLQQAIDMERAKASPDPGDLATSLNNLALVERARGNNEQARELLERSLDHARVAWGDEHVYVASLLESIASLQARYERYEEAEAMLLQALSIREKRYGSTHPDVANSHQQLGLLYSRTGQDEAAEEHLRAALDQRLALFGENHAATARSLNSLALLHYQRQRFEDAEQVIRRAIRVKKDVLGDVHRSTLISEDTLGVILSATERFTEAEAVVRPALDRAIEGAVDDPYIIAMLKRTLGSSLLGQDRFEEAEPYLLEAYDYHAADFGPESFRTEAIGRLVTSLYEGWGREDARLAWERRLLQNGSAQ